MVDLQYRYEKTIHEQLLERDYFSDLKLGFDVCEDAYLIPRTIQGKTGGVYDHNGYLIKDTSTNLEYGCEFFDVRKTDTDEISTPSIYLGVYESCWGHFITDCLKKVWFIKSDLFDPFKEYSLVLLSEQSSDLGANHKRLLELLGIDASKIRIITKNTRVKSIVVPNSCFYYDDNSVMHYTKEYIGLIESITSQYSYNGNKQYEKIYYSYSHYQKKNGYKKTFGEQKLEEFFRKRGYLIVYPENHSLDEQLTMLANCKYFASTEGSTSHNSLFLKEDSQVLIIPRGPYFSGYQQTIDSVKKQNTFYIDSSLTAFSSKTGPWSGPNYFYVSEELMDFFRLPDAEKACFRKDNFRDLYVYVRYCLVCLGGRKYFINNVYSEKFFYYLGLNAKKIFPFYSIKAKISYFFQWLKRHH